MSRQVTLLIPNTAQAEISGIGRIEIGTRVIKGWKHGSTNPKPDYRLTIKKDGMGLRNLGFMDLASHLTFNNK